MLYAFIFIFGSIIGSFLNVCIYRIPRKEAVIFSRSKCPSCKRLIKWYDNIPLLSYILLGAKCRYCREKISFRYFLVELISAVSFLFLFIYFGHTHLFWIYSLVTFGLIVVSFVDVEFQIIPDRITIGGLFLGLVLSAWMPIIHNGLNWIAGLGSSILGAFTGGTLIYITGFLGQLAFKKESMGGGDVKLMTMLGAFLGWKKVVLVFFLAPFFGTPMGLYLKFKKKYDVIPYGPYLSLAGFVSIMWGDEIIRFLFFRQ